MKVLLYTFIAVMVLESIVHATKREGMMSAEDIIAQLEAGEDEETYEDESEY